MLKRAARGHDPLGVDVTQEGELAVECPACPHPDRNLPEGWEDAPPHVRYFSCPPAQRVTEHSLLAADGFIPNLSRPMPISAQVSRIEVFVT